MCSILIGTDVLFDRAGTSSEVTSRALTLSRRSLVELVRASIPLMTQMFQQLHQTVMMLINPEY
jgi:hypothetical protein